MKQKRKYSFDWRDGNRFALLVDAGRYFPAMLGAIESAKVFIFLEIYLFESGSVANRFIDALLLAARRGVSVKILCDDFGTRGLSHYDRQRICESGIGLEFYNPIRFGKHLRNIFRDHRKILVVDGETAYVGGTGLTDDFDPPDNKKMGWHDMMLEIKGPVLTDWCFLFAAVWQRGSNVPLLVNVFSPQMQQEDMTGRVTGANGLLKQDVKKSFMSQVGSARNRVWMATAYFVPSWRIRRRLRQAARRGADVRLLLPGPHTDHPAVRRAGQRFYSRLLRRGVRIFEYQPRVLHAKAILCDNWVSIGSSNLDRWSMRWNLEANQEINDAGFAEVLAVQFAADFADSNELDYQQWSRRPRHVRLSEWFWGIIDLWLSRLGHDKPGRHP